MPKTRPLCTGAESNLRVLGEVEKDSFIALLGKGRRSGLLPSKTVCPNPGGFVEEFYSSSSRAELLIRLRYVQGRHSLIWSQVLSLSFFLAMLHSMQDLSSLTRDRTCAPCSGSMES